MRRAEPSRVLRVDVYCPRRNPRRLAGNPILFCVLHTVRHRSRDCPEGVASEISGAEIDDDDDDDGRIGDACWRLVSCLGTRYREGGGGGTQYQARGLLIRP